MSRIFAFCYGVLSILADFRFVEAFSVSPSPPAPVTENLKARQRGLEISASLVAISGCIIVGIVVLVVVCYFVARRRNREFDSPRPDMLILMKNEEHTMIPATIRETTKTVISFLPGHTHNGVYKARNQEAIDKLLADIRNAELEKTEASSGETEIVQGARDAGTLPIRKDYRLHFLEHGTNLHISKLEDFYGNRILLAMAPLKTQLPDHWEAIWRQSVGVVVWVGHFAEHNVERMEPYIGMMENDEVHHGHFRVKTVYARNDYLVFDVYRVLMHRTGLAGNKKITFIHAHSWQQNSVSSSLQKDVDLLKLIKQEHAKHIADGLPTMLFQDQFGTAGAATLLAVYTGFQMWTRFSKVNMFGILQYVRRRRWLAFEHTGDKSMTFLTQVQVAYAVMYAVAKWHETGQVSVCEQWIKNILTEKSLLEAESPAEHIEGPAKVSKHAEEVKKASALSKSVGGPVKASPPGKVKKK